MIEPTDDQQMVARMVREFVVREIMPVAAEKEHRDEYPHALVETIKSRATAGPYGLAHTGGAV